MAAMEGKRDHIDALLRQLIVDPFVVAPQKKRKAVKTTHNKKVLDAAGVAIAATEEGCQVVVALTPQQLLHEIEVSSSSAACATALGTSVGAGQAAAMA